MNPENFRESTAGKCIVTPQKYWAFLPNSLPPKVELNWELANLISDADRALSELSGAGRLLPNPHLLIGPYMRREAVLSSRIENTQAGMNDLFFFEADDTELPASPDVKEVANYVLAMERGLVRLNQLPISSRLVREIHACLMEGVRGGQSTPGEFRNRQNWIGPPGCKIGESSYTPPPVNYMLEALAEWEKYLHSDCKEPPLVQCALMHYQFEAIHPFIDGNGRIGRLLITFYMCERGYLSQPLLYLSAFLEKYRDEYFRRLLAISQKGDWKSWIEFFLRGVAIQARESLENANQILDLHERYRKMLGTKRVPQIAARLIDQLFINPVISIAKFSKDWKVPFPTVKNGVEKLLKLNILREVTGRRRNRLFAAPDLLDILVPDAMKSAQEEKKR